MKVKLISATQPLGGEFPIRTPEGLMAYTARVSSPHQDSPDYVQLLKYCIRKKHWSVFELADMTVEIETSRAIAQQILRHRSFTFQEFSQRYAAVGQNTQNIFEFYEARRQDEANRQNSIDDMSAALKEWFVDAQRDLSNVALEHYVAALDAGIAKEQARFLLPLSTTTKLYMKGSCRSWIHYLELRCDPATQKEHRDIANEIKHIFCSIFPNTAQALWTGE